MKDSFTWIALRFKKDTLLELVAVFDLFQALILVLIIPTL